MEQNINNTNTNTNTNDLINDLLNSFSNQTNSLSNDLTQQTPLFGNVTNSRNVNEPRPLRMNPNPNSPLSYTISGQPHTTSQSNNSRPTQPDMLLHNERYTLLLNVIQTTRVVMQTYSNQMRDYQTNVANVLQQLNHMYQDIYRDNRINPVPQQQHRNFNTGFNTNYTSNQNRNDTPDTPNTPNILRRRTPTRWNDVLTTHFQNIGFNMGNELFSLRPSNNQDDLWLANLLLRMSQPQENVIVAPTSQQIEDATEDIVFNEENYDLINETRCPITLEDFQENQILVRISRCGHVFSREPFQNWFHQSVRCPVCRHDIRQSISSPLNNTANNDSLSNQVPLQRMNSSDSMRSNVSDVSDNVSPTGTANFIMLFPSNNPLQNNQNEPNV